MKSAVISSFWGVFFLFISLSLLAQKEQKALDSFLRNESLKQAGVSLKIWDLAEEKTILSHNEQISLIPASVLKLVSSAAALEHLGDEYLFETPMYYTGQISEEGVLEGDLVIEGGNDPSFGSAFWGIKPKALSAMILQDFRKKGIKSINGRVIVDDLASRKDPLFSPKWMWEDLGNYYAPSVFGVSFMDNTYELTLQSGSKNTPVKILETNPLQKGLTFENQIKIDNSVSNNVFINGIPYSNERILCGTMKENQSNYRIKGEMPDPALFLADWVTNVLKENKIPVSGQPTTTRFEKIASSEHTWLGTFVSMPLWEMTKTVNFRSNNHYAEYILAEFEKKTGLTLNEYWKEKGIPIAGQFIYDGSGLSPANAISARFLTDILIYMHERSTSAESFYLSLPLAGREGTVGSFLKGSILEGNARIKSGSMSNVQSYAGYIRYDGKSYAFAVLVNNFTGNRSELRRQLERLLCGLF